MAAADKKAPVSAGKGKDYFDWICLDFLRRQTPCKKRGDAIHLPFGRRFPIVIILPSDNGRGLPCRWAKRKRLLAKAAFSALASWGHSSRRKRRPGGMADLPVHGAWRLQPAWHAVDTPAYRPAGHKWPPCRMEFPPPAPTPVRKSPHEPPYFPPRFCL